MEDAIPPTAKAVGFLAYRIMKFRWSMARWMTRADASIRARKEHEAKVPAFLRVAGALFRRDGRRPFWVVEQHGAFHIECQHAEWATRYGGGYGGPCVPLRYRNYRANELRGLRMRLDPKFMEPVV